MTRVAITSDHAGFALKTEIMAWLAAQGHEVTDLGANSEAPVAYADYGYRLAEHIADGHSTFGVALCGSGVGISIAVNRHPACRCALVTDAATAMLSREHNDANVIALGARSIKLETARACIAAFLTTRFAGGRHASRVEKLATPPRP